MVLEEKKKILEDKKPLATRKSSEKIINLFSSFVPELIGGSADLTESNNTKAKEQKIITSTSFKGNYIHYGVREHAMAGIMNGISLHSELIPYGGTFLIFSDYCKPSIRLSALMKKRVVYIMTHDSIGLGEDGPTHQPIEQLSGLRAIPNLNVFRPADTTETLECWQIALETHQSPSVISLTRQNLNQIRETFESKNLSSKGAYEVYRSGNNIQITLMASGSEVEIALEASKKLSQKNIFSKVISFPCMSIFDKQEASYKNQILDETEHKISIEASNPSSWYKYVGNKGIAMGIESFGESAPYKQLYKHFKLTSDDVVHRALKLIKN